MKTFYTMLALLFTGLQTARAQFIWHPDLGTPRSGSVSLDWNARSYLFEVYDGNEFGRAGEIWDALDAQLQAAGVRWIRIDSVENPSDGTFEIWFDLDENTENLSRSIHLGYSYSSYFVLTQEAPDRSGEPWADLPANRRFLIEPGEEIEIPIYDTRDGVTYDVLQYYSDDDVEIYDTFIGTGGDCAYTSAFPEGDFGFEFAGSEFSVRYSDPLAYRYSFNISAISLNANGDKQRIYFDSYVKDDGTTVRITGSSSMAFLNRTIADHNAGKVSGWNPRMRLSHGYDSSSARGYIEIACPPNLTDEFVRGTLGLKNASGSKPIVTQNFRGAVQAAPVAYRYDRATSKVVASVEYTRPFVTYTLYRDTWVCQTKVGDGGPLQLSAPAAAGYYCIKATYAEGGLSDSATSAGIRYNYDMLALDDDRNWILTRTFNFDPHGDAEEEPVAYDVDYYDGLGYASLNVQVGASSNGGKDLLRPFAYDGLYREELQYLPYARSDSDGRYDDDAPTNQNAFYGKLYGFGTNDGYAYARTEYEPSALERVVRTYKPGRDFQDNDPHFTQTVYMGNAASTVPRLRTDLGNGSLIVDGYYAACELAGTQTTDEDGAVVVTFADKDGRTVCENRRLRSETSIENIITNYVYDDCGRLAWVVTPEGSDRLTTAETHSPGGDFAKRYCYVYRYDEWGRVCEKRFPGREPIYVVYNKGDRPMMTQDGLLREKRQWLTYTYDNMGRVTSQKLVTDSAPAPQTREALQAAFDAGTYPQLYYSTTAEELTKTVYDRYPVGLAASLAFQEIDDMTCDLTGIEPVTLLDTAADGLPTYERLAVLTDGGIDGQHERVYYYDYKGREIQRVELDFEGGILRTTSRYDLLGNLLAQRESYTRGTKTDVFKRTFTYDARNRLLTETARLNSGEPAVVTYSYDDVGQLTAKTYGRGTNAIHETMDYNMQGWLTRKESQLFEMELRYFNLDPTFDNEESYSGNIAEWEWRHKEIDGSSDGAKNLYLFHYDDLSRLKESALTYNDSDDFADDFVERGISYDKNSNIITLNRSAPSSADARSYRFNYSGNQRIRETNSNAAYGYDANGNIATDPLTGFYISYNLLNLPSVIYTEGDCGLYYAYLADGTKIGVGGYDEGYPTRYAGSLVYDDEEFESAPFGGGRIVASDNWKGSEIHYFLTDHLGSTRVVAQVTNDFCLDLDRRDYYPFGKPWNNPDLPTSGNRYTFSGKEQQALRGQDVAYSDFGARFYDSDGVTFLQQDPLLEKYFSIGQYNYCAGNPVRFTDKKGKSIKDAVAGFIAGITSNVSGNSELRDSYTPTNSSHYNSGLAAADATSFVAGSALVIAGGTAVVGGGAVAGGGTAFSGGTAAAVAIPAGAAISDAGILAIGMGISMMSNTNKNASQGYNRGNGPKPNNGEGKPHGNSDHNAKIDKKINSIRGEKATDIRKNQTQVNAAGEKVGNNRPDVQYNKDGQHYNYEVDRSAANNTAHEQVIKSNDPNSIFEGEIIK